MKDAINARSRIKGGLVIAIVLAVVGLMSRGRLTAQGGMTGTWSGTARSVNCGGAPPSCTPGTPMSVSILLSDTPSGFTGTAPDGSTIDGFFVNQTGDPVFTLRATVVDAGPCSPTVLAGSAFLNVAQNTLVGNVSGINTDCRMETSSFTLQKQP